MIASRLTRLIETHSDELASTLIQKWLSSEALANLGKVPPAELRQRVYEVYHNLSEWLLYRTEQDIERRYMEIGVRRATQNVPLSVVLGALAAVKQHLWEFVRREGLLGDHVELHQALELLQLVDHFFDRATFHTARGYEKETKRAALVREAVLTCAG